MNILDRMESRLAENKTAFKTYATVKAAAQAVEKKLHKLRRFTMHQETFIIQSCSCRASAVTQ